MTVDADSLSRCSYRLQEGTIELDEYSGNEGPLVIEPDDDVFGWIRRMAPPDWQRGLVVDSHDAAVKTSWLSLLVAIVRTCNVNWLSELDDLVAAENKLVQAATARYLEIAVPETIVCSDAEVARAALGDDVILKPLGVGHYFEGDTPFVIYTTAVDIEGAEMAALSTAPFLVQRRLLARRHLRVVTVLERVWAAGLEAESFPLDWRQEPIAHRSFVSGYIPKEVLEGARRLALELHLGYSSQDWVVCDDGCYVIDVNPGGQWLFLPEPMATEISDAIGAGLAGADA